MIMDLNSILERVCSALDVDIEAVKGNNRTSDLVNARRNYIHLSRKHTNKNLGEISKVLYRTHAMSLHHDRKHRELLDVDKKYARDSFWLESVVIPNIVDTPINEENVVDKMMVRNSYLQAELLRIKHELEISKLKIKRLTLNN